VRHGVSRLTFTDGLTGELDVLDRMRGRVFAQARTPDGFAQVTVDDEIGTIVWPGGAALAPEPGQTKQPPHSPATRARPSRQASIN
jgi:hypothetical protein